jgi:hypothetical protein
MNSHRTHKKNLIVSYKNLSEELRQILKETYPEGYRDYIQRFEKPNGDTIFVVPLETPDTMYMVKFDVVIDSAFEEDDGSKDYFDEEVEAATQSVTAAIEPMVIVAMAGIVGTMVIALLMPMMSMYDSLDSM